MTTPFIYTTGGTVQAGSGVYLSRRADDELLQLCRKGEFAYVLTPRQMGKSSLMVHTAEQLDAEGTTSIIIDLTKIGTTVTPDQWYLGLLTEIEETLIFDADIFEWWRQYEALSLTQRLTKFFEEVLLTETKGQIVVFVDEIDTTLSLDFTDDFFIVIRYFYVARAQKPDLRRLSFVLVGVASPGDLIRDSQRTPFNIGRRIDLTDFTEEEAKPLADGLDLEDKQAKAILGWVLEWTGGHPYLTQRLCADIARDLQEGEKATAWTEVDIAKIVSRNFFGVKSEQDNNLQFVRNMLIKQAPDGYKLELLNTYKEVCYGRRGVKDEEQSIIKSHLKLSGIVKKNGDFLKVRNKIYKIVFGRRWIYEHLSVNWLRKIRATATLGAVIFVILLIPFSIHAEHQRQIADEQRQDAIKQRQIAEEQRQIAEKERETIEKLLLGGSSRVQIQDVSPEVKAFLDTIAWSLGTLSENGYRLLANGEEFNSFENHPRRSVCGQFYGNKGIILADVDKNCLNAAGRYHIILKTWEGQARRLELEDFSPESQDAAGIQILKDFRAFKHIESGDFKSAVHNASGAWTTLPTETGETIYGDKIYSIEQLEIVYTIFLTRYRESRFSR